MSAAGNLRSTWLARRRSVSCPAARVYCFPHSGGSVGEYLRWSDELPELELYGVLLPGRGPRRREPSATSLIGLAIEIVREVHFRPPHVLFGHSFGALLAYHVAQHLRSRALPSPGLLVLSAAPPPHLPWERPVLSTLPDEVFLRRLGEVYGGVPTELQENPELAAVVAAPCRADLAILERYRDPGLPPLDCPILVLGGDQDELCAHQLWGWARHTTGRCHLRLLPGGHFYFRQRPATLPTLLREWLECGDQLPG